jgi:hypothetical protein
MGHPCKVEGPIMVAPPNMSMVTNQNICILKSQSSPYLFQESICSHANVPHFTQSYMQSLQAFKSFLIGESIVENRQQKLVCLLVAQFGSATDSL